MQALMSSDLNEMYNWSSTLSDETLVYTLIKGPLANPYYTFDSCRAIYKKILLERYPNSTIDEIFILFKLRN